MEIVFLLLPLSLVIAAAALGGYLWSVRSGQYDDLDTPAHRMLIDEDVKSDESEVRDVE